MSIFVQTESHIFDVSKITWVDAPPGEKIAIHFDNGMTKLLNQPEAEQLFEVMENLRRDKLIHAIVARRVVSETTNHAAKPGRAVARRKTT